MTIASVRSVKHRVALGGDSVELHLEAPTPFAAAEDAHDPFPATDAGIPDVLPEDVVCHDGLCRVEVLILQRVQEGLHRPRVGRGVHC